MAAITYSLRGYFTRLKLRILQLNYNDIYIKDDLY